MVIYCSNQLQKLLPPRQGEVAPPSSSVLGDWNGNLITVDRRKCMLFMHNKTCYSVLMINVHKKDVKDFAGYFRERLIVQLDYDLKITENEEVRFRRDLSEIIVSKTNNDRKIIGTMNTHINTLYYPGYQGGISNWDEVRINHILNERLVGTKIPVKSRNYGPYFTPTEAIRNLLR